MFCQKIIILVEVTEKLCFSKQLYVVLTDNRLIDELYPPFKNQIFGSEKVRRVAISKASISSPDLNDSPMLKIAVLLFHKSETISLVYQLIEHAINGNLFLK